MPSVTAVFSIEFVTRKCVYRKLCVNVSLYLPAAKGKEIFALFCIIVSSCTKLMLLLREEYKEEKTGCLKVLFVLNRVTLL